MTETKTPGTLSPPLKYHGGKNYLADKIIPLMPEHIHYVEPFFGGGAVMLAKESEGVSEVANDINGWLTNFWSVLSDLQLFEEFIRLAEAMPFSQRRWEQAAALMRQKPMVRQHNRVRAALIFFVFCRQSRAGLMQDFATLSRNRVRRGMNEQASAWLTAVDGLRDVHDRLKRVVILNKPAIQVIQQQDGPGTLQYLDPPYLHETRSSTDSYGPYEMSVEDHAELLDTIKQCEGKVMLSGYDNQLYKEQLADWTRHEFDLPNNAAGGAKKARMTEVVWCNF
jgi:DNA adenine methylase